MENEPVNTQICNSIAFNMKPIILCCLILCTVVATQAQHCPFDGSTVVVIKVVNKKGKPVTRLTKPFQLVEVDNPEADSCSFSQGLLNKNFAEARTAVMDRYPGSWKSWAEKYKDCPMFKPGCYAIVLSMDQDDCMIKQGNDYRYRERKFEIRYDGKLLKAKLRKPLPEQSRYSLCTDGGSWCRIKPMEIVVE